MVMSSSLITSFAALILEVTFAISVADAIVGVQGVCVCVCSVVVWVFCCCLMFLFVCFGDLFLLVYIYLLTLIM